MSIAGSSTPAGRAASSASGGACRSASRAACSAAALDGSLQKADFRTDPHFGLAVPEQVPGVEPHILDPIKTWRSKGEFAETAGALVQMFRDNFKKFEDHTDERVRAAGPAPRIVLAGGA